MHLFRSTLSKVFLFLYLSISTGRLSDAKDEAGNSMIKYQQIVFPICTEIQVGGLSKLIILLKNMVLITVSEENGTESIS